MGLPERTLAADAIPYAITIAPNRPLLRMPAPGALAHDVVVIDAADPTRAAFCALLNHTNQLAFGGDNMGMPRWVLLDCGIIPGAVVGFAVPRAHASAPLLERIGMPADYPDALLPVSEYCGCPTLAPDTISGFSLQSQITGCGLATRTKALAMALYGARAVVGVTQFTNPSIRVHAKLGALEILVHRPVVHTHAHNSFVYRLELPPAPQLWAVAAGQLGHATSTLPEGARWEMCPQDEADHERLREALASGRRAWIVPPGWSARGADGNLLHLVLSS